MAVAKLLGNRRDVDIAGSALPCSCVVPARVVTLLSELMPKLFSQVVDDLSNIVVVKYSNNGPTACALNKVKHKSSFSRFVLLYLECSVITLRAG